MKTFRINATLDFVTCPRCRTCVFEGTLCDCRIKTRGPSVENVTRKTLTGELDAKAAQ